MASASPCRATNDDTMSRHRPVSRAGSGAASSVANEPSPSAAASMPCNHWRQCASKCSCAHTGHKVATTKSAPRKQQQQQQQQQQGGARRTRYLLKSVASDSASCSRATLATLTSLESCAPPDRPLALPCPPNEAC